VVLLNLLCILPISSVPPGGPSVSVLFDIMSMTTVTSTMYTEGMNIKRSSQQNVVRLELQYTGFITRSYSLEGTLAKPYESRFLTYGNSRKGPLPGASY